MRPNSEDARKAGQGAWRTWLIADEADRQAFANEARAKLDIRELNHDVEWLAAGRADGEEVLVVAASANGALQAAMPIRAAPAEIEYTLGGFRVFKRRVRQFNLVQGPLTTGGDRRAAALAVLERLAGVVPPDGAVFASAVPCDGDLHALLEDKRGALRKTFHVLKWGNPNWHCKIEWRAGVEDYLATLGADSRRNFKRYTKKLFADQDAKPVVERFRTPEEVERFLVDGAAVSDKTYQKKDLGLGIERGGPMERRFRFAASRGSFLGHILYLRGEPIAFHYGFVYGETFFVVQMGYDPAFARVQPGAVLFYCVLQDVEKLGLPVKVIDCLPGVTDFKLRTTNRKERIQNFYLFKRSLSGSATFAILKTIDAAARAAKRVLERNRAASGADKRTTRTSAAG